MSLVIPFDPRQSLDRPLFLSPVAAGFPSPAEDYVEKRLNLNEFLIKHPAATFFVHAQGNSMTGAGIHSGDILVVDRSLEAAHGRIVIAEVNGEFMVKRLMRRNCRVSLASENPKFPPVEITEDSEATVWGVVTFAVHDVLKS